MMKIKSIISILSVLAILSTVGCAGTETSRSTGTYIDDKTISTKVETQLAIARGVPGVKEVRNDLVVR